MGGAGGWGGAKPRQRRAGLFEEWRQQPAPLLLRAADQERQQSKDGSNQRQGNAGVHRVELLDDDRSVGETSVLSPGGKRNAFPQKSCRNDRLVSGPRRGEPFLWSVQSLRLQRRRRHLPCELAGLEL